MSTPLQNLPEWDPSTTDGPSQVAALARAAEQQLVLRFTSAASRDAAFTAAGVDPSGAVARLDDDANALYVHDGTTWFRHGPDSEKPQVRAGSVTFDFNNETAKTVSVTFSKPLGGTPHVTLSHVGGAGEARDITLWSLNKTPNGFDAFASHQTAGELSTASLLVDWIAVYVP